MRFGELEYPEKEAYLLGALTSDGNMYKNGRKWRFRFAVKDEEFFNFVRKIVKDLSKVSWDGFKAENGLKRIDFRLEDIESKYRGLNEGKNIFSSEDEKEKFITGFFDGDGCFYQRERKNHISYQIIFVGKKKKLLELVNRILEDLGFDSNKRTFGGTIYLTIYKKNEKRTFFRKINPVIPRKNPEHIEENLAPSYTDKFLINHIRGLYEKLGRMPTQQELIDSEGPNQKPYYNHFGSWNKAKEIARGDFFES